MTSPKKLSLSMPALADQNIDFVGASNKAGVGSQHFKVIASGATHVVVFADIVDLVDMEDPDYVVQVNGETVARVTVDESTLAESGFSILGAAAAEVLHVSVHGRLKGLVA